VDTKTRRHPAKGQRLVLAEPFPKKTESFRAPGLARLERHDGRRCKVPGVATRPVGRGKDAGQKTAAQMSSVGVWPPAGRLSHVSVRPTGAGFLKPKEGDSTPIIHRTLIHLQMDSAQQLRPCCATGGLQGRAHGADGGGARRGQDTSSRQMWSCGTSKSRRRRCRRLERPSWKRIRAVPASRLATAGCT